MSNSEKVEQPASWTVIAAFALAVATTQILWLTFAPIDTDVARDFGVSKNAVGWLANIFPAFYVLVAIPAGLALDRWFRPTLLTGAGLAAAGGLLRLIGPSFTWLLIGQIVASIAQPMIVNSTTKAATGYLPAPQRPIGIAIGSGAQFLGAIVALVLGPALEGSHSIATLLRIEAAIGVLAFLVLLLVLRRPPATAGPPAGAGLEELRAVWNVRLVRSLSGVLFVGVGIFVAISTYLQPMLSHDSISSTDAGLMLAGMLAAGTIGCAVTPPIVARRSAERGYLLIAIIFVAGATALMAAVQSLPAADFVVIALLGFFLLAALPVILEMTERRMGASGGVATGILLLMGNAGGIVVATILGFITGTPALGFLLLTVVAICGLPFVNRLRTLPETALPATTLPENTEPESVQ